MTPDDEQAALFPNQHDEALRDFAAAVPTLDRERPASGYAGGRSERGRARPATAPCRSCAAPMLWVTFPSGKRNPLDPTPNPDGNIVLVEHEDRGGRPWRLAMVVGNEDLLAEARALGVPLYTTHFKTCPDAEEHRRERSRERRDLQ